MQRPWCLCLYFYVGCKVLQRVLFPLYSIAWFDNTHFFLWNSMKLKELWQHRLTAVLVSQLHRERWLSDQISELSTNWFKILSFSPIWQKLNWYKPIPTWQVCDWTEIDTVISLTHSGSGEAGMRKKLFYCCFLIFLFGGLLWLQMSRSRQEGGFVGYLSRWDSPASWGHMGWLGFIRCWGGLVVHRMQLYRLSWVGRLGCYWGNDTAWDLHQLLLEGYGAMRLCWRDDRLCICGCWLAV